MVYKKNENMVKESKGSSGNTKRNPIRSRSWFFTWNNYDCKMAQLAEIFDDLDVEYVFQEETGDNGTPHIQGCIRFKNPQRMGFQEEFPKEIHWERCRNWRKATKYCSKRLTRTGQCLNNIGLKIRKTIKDPMDGKKLYDWEKEILEVLKKEPDVRS